MLQAGTLAQKAAEEAGQLWSKARSASKPGAGNKLKQSSEWEDGQRGESTKSKEGTGRKSD